MSILLPFENAILEFVSFVPKAFLDNVGVSSSFLSLLELYKY
jgi:hypothetical protein